MSLVQYIPTNTILHRLDPRVKLLLVPFVITMAFVLSKPLTLLAMVLIILGAWIYIKAPFSHLQSMLTVIGFLMLFITIMQGLFYTQRSSEYGTGSIFSRDEQPSEVDTPAQEILVDLIPRGLRSTDFVTNLFGDPDKPDRALVLYKEGVLLGLTLGLRLANIVLIMPLITMTTSLTDLMLALTKLYVPWTIAYLVVISFRFVPVLMNQMDTILSAQKLRGLDVEKANIVKRITAYAPLAIPVILGAFKDSEQLEMVLAVRGFTTDIVNRTTLYEIAWERKDTIAVALMASVVVISIGLRLTVGSHFI